MKIEILKRNTSELFVEQLAPVVKAILLMYLYQKKKISYKQFHDEIKKMKCEFDCQKRDKKLPLDYKYIYPN